MWVLSFPKKPLIGSLLTQRSPRQPCLVPTSTARGEQGLFGSQILGKTCFPPTTLEPKPLPSSTQCAQDDEWEGGGGT